MEEPAFKRLEAYEIANFPYDYGKISHWKCYNHMLRYALLDKDVERIVFVSDQCLPFVSFNSMRE